MQDKLLARVLKYAHEHRHILKWKKIEFAIMYGASFRTIAIRRFG